ncbi:unnamed protein product, partial [Choristocarpus tenellus]
DSATVSVFLRVRPPGKEGADEDEVTGQRTYEVLGSDTTLRTHPPSSSSHSRTINRQ